MGKPRVGVVGYGVIGQRLADAWRCRRTWSWSASSTSRRRSRRGLCEAGCRRLSWSRPAEGRLDAVGIR
jgi:hypothetical protein